MELGCNALKAAMTFTVLCRVSSLKRSDLHWYPSILNFSFLAPSLPIISIYLLSSHPSVSAHDSLLYITTESIRNHLELKNWFHTGYSQEEKKGGRRQKLHRFLCSKKIVKRCDRVREGPTIPASRTSLLRPSRLHGTLLRRDAVDRTRRCSTAALTRNVESSSSQKDPKISNLWNCRRPFVLGLL